MAYLKGFSAASFLIVCLGNAHAALHDRGGGLLYDDVLNVTWLQDANYAKTSGYSEDGLLTWESAMNWAAGLNFGGYQDWRLPKTPTTAGACSLTAWSVTAENCIGSELGSLFYTTLGNVGPSDDPRNFGLVNSGPFNNLLRPHGYWSETTYPRNDLYAYYFHMDSGFLSYSQKANLHYAVAVRDGDVAAPVPEPETYALMAAGIGLLGFQCRRRSAART